MMKHFKDSYPTHEEYMKHEFRSNVISSFAAGAIASALTNSFEVVTINKQADPRTNIYKLIKQERFKLYTKGLFARVSYNSLQSVVFFNILMQIGKIYDVELSDE
jgi:hypothetical protein